MDGETIVDAAAELGYMHRNFEKMAGGADHWQIIPYTDRLNYCSSFTERPRLGARCREAAGHCLRRPGPRPSA